MFVVALLALVTNRREECFQNASKILGFHIFAVWIYNRKFPLSITWLTLHAVLTIESASMAEWTCSRAQSENLELTLSPQGVNNILKLFKIAIIDFKAKVLR